MRSQRHTVYRAGKDGALVLSGAELPEVFRSLGCHIYKKLHLNPARWQTPNRDVCASIISSLLAE